MFAELPSANGRASAESVELPHKSFLWTTVVMGSGSSMRILLTNRGLDSPSSTTPWTNINTGSDLRLPSWRLRHKRVNSVYNYCLSYLYQLIGTVCHPTSESINRCQRSNWLERDWHHDYRWFPMSDNIIIAVIIIQFVELYVEQTLCACAPATTDYNHDNLYLFDWYSTAFQHLRVTLFRDTRKPTQQSRVKIYGKWSNNTRLMGHYGIQSESIALLHYKRSSSY